MATVDAHTPHIQIGQIMTQGDKFRLPDLMTIPEVACMLSVHPRTIKRMIQRGDLRGVRLSSRMWRIDAREVLRFVQQGYVVSLKKLGRW